MRTIYKILFLFFIVSLHTQAQVTIGSDKRPNPGALLEFAENASDSTSRRGLLLPRVLLNSLELPTPLSAHVAGMMVYNKTVGGNVDKQPYINDGSKWKSLTIPQASASGQYLVLNSSLEPEWQTIPLPPVTPGIFTLINSQSSNLYQMRTIQADDSPWMPFGDTIRITPRHTTNKLVVTVQVLFNKEYSATQESGWISYSAGIFTNENDFMEPQDFRNETLVFQAFNDVRTFAPVTLHFVLENVPLGDLQLIIKFKRNKSENFDGILYIGYDERIIPGNPPGNINFFNTSSSISSQYFEDKSS